jgi:flagellum-specific ATP synthase
VQPPPLVVEGKLSRVTGMTLEASGCEAALGARCLIEIRGNRRVEAEVVGFGADNLYLMPLEDLRGLRPNARVIPTLTTASVPVGDALLGRVIDGAGQPLDGRGPLRCGARAPLEGCPMNPLSRQPITEALDVGVRSINALLTTGRGQRLGLFTGRGIGASSLLAMMTRFSAADVVVIGLIGERGREIKEFVEDNLGGAGLARAVIVAAPADRSPLMRVHGALSATSIAEYFRDQGKDVLLLMDSLTRFAQAQREIGLAIGEPPATRGYPPSVFARLTQLVERAGTRVADRGSITAFYTILADGDEEQDPVIDAARAVLDGHVMLSRQIADSGIYPPVDLEASVSRSMLRVASPEQLRAAQRFREVNSYYLRHRDLIDVGAYRIGADAQLDRAVALWPRIEAFLTQDQNQPVGLPQSIGELTELISEPMRADTQPSGRSAPPPSGSRHAG